MLLYSTQVRETWHMGPGAVWGMSPEKLEL